MKGFTKISDEVLKDSNLSLRSKFMLAKATNVKEGWKFNKAGVMYITNFGRKACESSLRELESNGYCVITKAVGRTPSKIIFTASKQKQNMKAKDLKDDFTMVHNKILCSSKISVSAKILLAILMSEKEEYVFSKKELMCIANIRKDTLNKLLKELDSIGFTIETIKKRKNEMKQMPLFGDNKPIKQKVKIKRKSNETPAADQDFEKFYQEYPRKKNKSLARVEWNKLSPIQKAKILEVMPNWIEYCKVLKSKGESRFINYPNTFISKEIFEDDVNEWKEVEPILKVVKSRVVDGNTDWTQSKLKGWG